MVAVLGLVRQGAGAGPTTTEGSPPMQQWLDLVPVAGSLLNLAAGLTNLITAIINRRKAGSHAGQLTTSKTDSYHGGGHRV
jgi:hypothetical protein